MDFEEPVPDQGIYVDAEQYLGLERDKGEKAPENINIFGFVMQKPKPAVEMAIMALFALISHHAYSTMQEWVAAKKDPASDKYLTFVNIAVFVICANVATPKSPLRLMGAVGLLQAMVLFLSNRAASSSTSGAQLAFKSMQVVPVLVLRVFLLHKRYLLWDYLAVGLMVLGITTFSVVDYSDGIKADLTASMCMLVALLLNGVINALQERILSRYGSSYAELVYFSQLTTGSLLFLSFVLRGEVRDVLFTQTHSTQLLCLLFSFVGYAAMMAVLLLMRSFGCVAAVLVTSSRRLAVGLFGLFTLQGGLTGMHAIGILIFAVGILIRAAHWLQLQQRLRLPLPRASPFAAHSGSPTSPRAVSPRT